MKVKVRQLTGTMNWKEVQARVAEEQVVPTESSDGGLLGYGIAAVTTPRKVAAHEAEVDVAEVERLLAIGKLTPRDLVFERDQWICFCDSVQFGDAAARVEQRTSQLRTIAAAGVALAAILAAILYFAAG